MKLVEIKKEDDTYFQGAFWIIADSVKDIHQGNFTLLGETLLSDWNGNYLGKIESKKGLAHQRIWRDYQEAGKVNTSLTYTYYPRGRVAIHGGVAYIHLNSKVNCPKLIDTIIDKYQIKKLEQFCDFNDIYQGSHYDFQLK